jgi:predicted transcriptional regulator
MLERTVQRGHSKRCYYAPAVMLALRQLGGRARRRDVIELVARILPLADVDRKQKGANSQIHYVYMTSKARQDLVEEGLLEPWEIAGRGWWEFTDKGLRQAQRIRSISADLGT